MARDFLENLAILKEDPNRQDWALLNKLWPGMTAKERLVGLEIIYSLDSDMKYSQKLMDDLFECAER